MGTSEGSIQQELAEMKQRLAEMQSLIALPEVQVALDSLRKSQQEHLNLSTQSHPRGETRSQPPRHGDDEGTPHVHVDKGKKKMDDQEARKEDEEGGQPRAHQRKNKEGGLVPDFHQEDEANSNPSLSLLHNLTPSSFEDTHDYSPNYSSSIKIPIHSKSHTISKKRDYPKSSTYERSRRLHKEKRPRKAKTFKAGDKDTKFDSYNGRRDESKALAFIRQFEVAFANGHFSEESKIRHVGMYLKDTASNWWLTKILEGTQAKTWT